MDQSDDLNTVLVINQRVRIPRTELEYQFTRSSGPGGQNVNKTETAVELSFDLAHSPSLANQDRTLAMQRLATALDTSGVLHLVAHSERSQYRNREEVTERFVLLMRDALTPVKHRRRTRPSRASRETRLEGKHRAGSVKRSRQRPSFDD